MNENQKMNDAIRAAAGRRKVEATTSIPAGHKAMNDAIRRAAGAGEITDNTHEEDDAR